MPDLTLVDPATEGELVGSPAMHKKLVEFERGLSDALAQADRFHWKALFLLYYIHKTECWRAAADDDGKPYVSFERYISDLGQRIPRCGVRWAQQGVSMISLCTDVLELDPEEITQSSPSKLREVRRMVRYDDKTKKIEYLTPGGRDEVIEMIHDAAQPGVRLADIKNRVNGALSRPSISYQWMPAPVPRAYLTEAIIRAHRDDLAYNINLSYAEGMPQEIVDDLKRRLSCSP